jgi:hypothetical protein
MKKILYGAGIITMVLLGSCSKQFLTQQPLGSASLSTLTNASGVNQLLIGAYSLLDGEASQSGYNYGSGAENWVYGDVVGGNSYKGSTPSDQPDILTLETFTANAANGYPVQKWQANYEGIARVNQTIIAANQAPDLSASAKAEILAECKFLRALYHFELVQLFKNIPYIDETVTNFVGVTNTTSVYPKIEADFQAAIAVLPTTQSQPGRPTLGAAEALLGKVYLYAGDYTDALAQFNKVISSGLYSLTPNFYNNFNIDTKNNSEEIYQVQYAVNVGATEPNGDGNYGDILNFPNGPGAPEGCCGFNLPSQNLVNAYQTDANGLPLFNTYATTNFKNDAGILSSAPFTPDTTTNVDPRLDWTVGRRGIPFLDWGNMPGAVWIRDPATDPPYVAKKMVYRQSQSTTDAATSGWDVAVSANNYSIIRYADVLLMAAECEAQVGSLVNATQYVNLVRARAAASPVYQVDGTGKTTTKPAAHYVVGLYPTFATQAYALQAIFFERRLELAMEGHFFFDLVRTGNAPAFFQVYFAHPYPAGEPISGSTFTTGKDEVFAIPQTQIDLSTVNGKPTLTQNPGY